jgi:hypothetical protein
MTGNLPAPPPPARGAVRRRLMLLLIASLLLIPSVIGYEASHTFDDSYSYHEYGTYKSYGGRLGFSALRFNNIEDFSGLKHVAVVYDHIIAGIKGYPDAGTTSVTGTIESDVIFTGRIGYNINRDKDGSVTNVVLWIDEINNFDPHGYTGRKDVRLEWNKSIVPTPDTYGAKMFNSATPDFAAASDRFQSNWVILAPYSSSASTVGQYGRYMYLIENPWKNTVHVVYDDTGYDIHLYRHGFFSSVDITEIATGISYYSSPIASTDDNIHIPRVWLTDPKLNISVITGSNKRLSWEVNPPPLDQPILVPVAVRSAQTGDLIAGAQVAILDTKTNETISITLASGSGTVNLRETTSFRYHASAAAANYTLISPIVFGVVEGTSIVLWMSPDTPPDDPIEEGKSMLYGYILTQGSQQPIAGATVSLDGYGSTTTSSTGFYLFNNVTPGAYTISASAPLHDALSEPVTVDPAATQHNLALKGHFLLTVTAKDDTSLTNLHNATISLSDGQESTQNPATFTADYGSYTITAAAGGYYPQTQSAYLDRPGTTAATVLLTARPPDPTPPELPNYPPHNVKFTVQTLLGTPIPGVTVTAQGIQQTPSTNIIERLLGINTTTTPITTELMSGTTDSNGEINFMMIEAVKYQITIKKPGVVDQTLEIYPKEDTYPIIISTTGGPLLPDAGDPLRDIHINITTSTEGDIGHIHIDYNDTTRKTTNLSIQVTQQNTTNTSAPEDVIATYTVANDANVTHTFDLPNYKGQSFFVRLEAEHPDFGTINRDYAVAFKGVRVPLGPLPDGLYIYVAGFGLMLLGGIFGATSATRGVVVIAFAGWLFYAFGWLDDLGLIAPVSLGLVSTIAVMGVIVTRYREEGYQ